jgi:tetratricopeptide (TPR) repeat protein
VLGGLVVAALLVGGGNHPAIEWRGDFDAALEEAKKTRKPLLVDFEAESCRWCARLDENTYRDPVVVELSRRFVPVEIDLDAGPDEVAIATRYKVSSLPSIVFISPSGHQLLKVDGFQGEGQFPNTMRAALKAAGKVAAWERDIDRDGKDAGALFGLGAHLFEERQYEQARELLSRARKLDAKRAVAERKRTRLLLGVVQYYDGRHVEAQELLREGLALGHSEELDPHLLYLLGRCYEDSGRPASARKVYEKVLAKYGASPVADTAREALRALSKARRDRHE